MTDTKSPIVRTNETPAYFDVDETLIEKRPFLDTLNGFTLRMNFYGMSRFVRPIEQHVDFLKAVKARGAEVTVWSANGFTWAHEVVIKLGLEKYVDYICTKPQFYVDDKPAEKWTKQIFLGENE